MILWNLFRATSTPYILKTINNFIKYNIGSPCFVHLLKSSKSYVEKIHFPLNESMYKRVSGTSFSINYFVSSSTWHMEYTDEVHSQRSSQILIVFFPSSFPLLHSFLLPSIFSCSGINQESLSQWNVSHRHIL